MRPTHRQGTYLNLAIEEIAQAVDFRHGQSFGEAHLWLTTTQVSSKLRSSTPGTGEIQERRLQHRDETEESYRDLAAQGMNCVWAGKAIGHAQWFERLLGELHFERGWGTQRIRGRRDANISGSSKGSLRNPDVKLALPVFPAGKVGGR